MGNYGYIDVNGLQLLNGFNRISKEQLIETIETIWGLTKGQETNIKIDDVIDIKQEIIRLYTPALSWNQTLLCTMVDFLWEKVLHQTWEEGNNYVTVKPNFNFKNSIFTCNRDKYKCLYPSKTDNTIYQIEHIQVEDTMGYYGHDNNVTVYHNVDSSNFRSVLENMEKEANNKKKQFDIEKKEVLVNIDMSEKTREQIKSTDNDSFVHEILVTDKQTQTLLEQFDEYKNREDEFGKKIFAMIVSNLKYIHGSNKKIGIKNCDKLNNIVNEYKEKKKSGRPTNEKIILCIDPQNNEVLERYKSITDIIKYNEGYDKSGLSLALSGKRKTYKGYIWKYQDL